VQTTKRKRRKKEQHPLGIWIEKAELLTVKKTPKGQKHLSQKKK